MTRPGRSRAWLRLWVPGRMLGSIQTRILLVILLSILPLAAISSLMAWRSYEAASGLGERRVDGLAVAFVARIDDGVQDAARAFHAIAAQPGLTDPATCRTILSTFEAFTADVYPAIAVQDTTGNAICAAGKAPVAGLSGAHDDHAFVAVRTPYGPIEMGRIAPRGDGAFTIPVRAHPLLADGRRLTISAVLRFRGVVAKGAAWVPADADTNAVAVAGALPPPSRLVLDQIAGGRAVARQADPPARSEMFAEGRLADGRRVVVGDRANAEESRAASLLFWRFTAIAVLLVGGILIVVALGHLTVTRPIRRLTRRVTHWRAGGVFDESPMRFIPTELADLTASFGLAARNLVTRERQLDRAREAQELAFKEIHHLVKNNLQIIASLLNLQASRIRVPEARAEFQSARDRVRALATLHRHLYTDSGGGDGLHTLAMRSFLLELCGQLFQAIGEREGHRIRLDVEAPELQMSSDQAVPLALIVTEAVSNAVKYAFPAGRSGHVLVRLTLLDDDQIELVVQDDGVGIPAGRAETETGVRDGLGLQLIRGFARQLGGTLEVTEANGTRYRIVLALRRAHAGDDENSSSGERKNVLWGWRR